MLMFPGFFQKIYVFIDIDIWFMLFDAGNGVIRRKLILRKFKAVPASWAV